MKRSNGTTYAWLGSSKAVWREAFAGSTLLRKGLAGSERARDVIVGGRVKLGHRVGDEAVLFALNVY